MYIFSEDHKLSSVWSEIHCQFGPTCVVSLSEIRIPYNREAAIAYARRWALSRNPAYYDYHTLGGDCTNFVSQCLHAGGAPMNYAKKLGWYYSGPSRHSYSWTAVHYLYEFLTRNKGIGPFGHEVKMKEAQPGDISQFAGTSSRFSHTQFILSVGNPPSLENILIAAHTIDSLDRPLSTYKFLKIRFIHIDGLRK